MRKTLLLCLCSIAFFNFNQLSAQIEKGHLYPGVTFNQGQGIKYGVQPSISLGIGKHGLIGVHTSHKKSDNFFYNDSKTYGIANGGGIDYTYFSYFKKSQKLGWFVTTGFTYYRNIVYQVKNDQKETNNKYGSTNIYMRPGLFFKASQKVMLFANIGGIGIESSRGNTDLDLNFASQINIGVLINLGSSKRNNRSF